MRFFGRVAQENASLKHSLAYFSFAIAAYFETAAQGVHRLDAHTVQADTLLESFGVVFTTCVQFADSFDEFTLWNTATVIAYTDTKVVLDRHFDFLAGAHLELIDRVIHHFFQQHIDTVVTLRTIAQTADVHT